MEIDQYGRVVYEEGECTDKLISELERALNRLKEYRQSKLQGKQLLRMHTRTNRSLSDAVDAIKEWKKVSPGSYWSTRIK